MAILSNNSAFKLAGTYAVFGALWIVVSDGVVWFKTRAGLADWFHDTAKGLFFIGVTTMLLYVLVRRLVSRHVAVEQELRESRKRWNFALQSAGTGIWEWNGETGESYFSPEWKALLGYADHELPNREHEWLERIHPEDRARVDEHMQRHMRGETVVYECEFRMRAKDGSYKWILSRGQIVSRDSEGRPRQAFGTHTDISHHKSAEARTAEALAFAQTILRSSPLGVIVYGADGRAVIANEAAARIVGADVATLLRQNYRQLDSWRSAGMDVTAGRALATGRSEMQKAAVTTSFGRRLQLVVHFVPLDFQGARHLMTVIVDQTAERQALDNLHLLHAALQATPSAWLITDAEGRIEWVNPAFTQVTGYAPEEAIGQTPRLLRSHRHKPEFYRQFWDTIRRGEVWSGEISNRRKDGSIYEERMTVAPVRDDDGVIRHFVAIKDDITDRKQLEQQVTRTQRLESIGLLASGIAHDLNNVLTPILLSIELLKIRYPDANARRYVETVETAAQRGAGIVRQVLTFARGMEGGERTEVQPRHLLKDLVRLIEETFPRNITIEYDAPRDVFPVVGDVTQLHQVLLNLAVNARDAMPSGGTLTLKARNHPVTAPADPALAPLKPGEYVAITVTDTGTGIPPEVLDRIFEPFFTTKPRGKGTGLGLSTVYGIVRDHGGAIRVHTKENEGTTFEAILPAAVTEVRRETVAVAAPVLQGEGRKILVVDDEEPIRLITARVLTGHGFSPVVAVDGQDGWREFQAQNGDFAAAIVDEMMPRMSGRDLARHIREATATVPVILVTGLMDGGSRPPAETNWKTPGVRLVLHKPYSEVELLKALGEVLGETPSA